MARDGTTRASHSQVLGRRAESWFWHYPACAAGIGRAARCGGGIVVSRSAPAGERRGAGCGVEHDSGRPARTSLPADTCGAEAARERRAAVGVGREGRGAADEVCMSWHEEMESHIAMRAEANERAGM